VVERCTYYVLLVYGIGIVVTWKVKRDKSIELFCGHGIAVLLYI